MNMLEKIQQLNHTEIWIAIFNDDEIQNLILNLIKEEQLFKKGVNEDGVVIGQYSPVTQMINPEKIAGEHYTLKDTGAFYNSLIINVLDDLFEIDGDPIKVNEFGERTNLFEKYGEGIIGLTEESKEVLYKEVRSRYIDELRRILQEY